MKINFNIVDEYWLDDKTYVVIFGDFKFYQVDGLKADCHLEAEYHADTNTYHFVIVAEYDRWLPKVGEIAPEKIREIINYIKTKINN